MNQKHRSFFGSSNPEIQLLKDVSLELLPEQVSEFIAGNYSLARSSLVFLAHIKGKALHPQVDAARMLIAAGFEPVPHLAARNFKDCNEFVSHVKNLTAANVRSLLLLGGNAGPDARPLGSAIDLLRHPCMKDSSVSRVLFGGYPEGHPVIPNDRLLPALLEKIELARDIGLTPGVVTQFGFDGGTMTKWALGLRKRGVDVPVRFGLAGVTSLPKLVKFAKFCGVGPSLTVLTRNIGSILKAVREHDPAGTVNEIERGVSEHSLGNVGLHFFPFGGFERTLAWLDRYRQTASRAAVKPDHAESVDVDAP